MSCEGRTHFLRGVSPNLAANDSTEPHGLMQRVELRSRICPNDSTRAKRKNVLRKKKATHPAQAKKPKKKKKKKKKKAKKKSPLPVVEGN
jgi:hypothetical protein